MHSIGIYSDMNSSTRKSTSSNGYQSTINNLGGVNSKQNRGEFFWLKLERVWRIGIKDERNIPSLVRLNVPVSSSGYPEVMK